jgi:hypothetical protein
MQITTKQLNEVANLIGTQEKSVVFGAVLKSLFENGIATDVAFDFVFGQGAYQTFSGNLYDALKAVKK